MGCSAAECSQSQPIAMEELAVKGYSAAGRRLLCQSVEFVGCIASSAVGYAEVEVADR